MFTRILEKEIPERHLSLQTVQLLLLLTSQRQVDSNTHTISEVVSVIHNKHLTTTTSGLDCQGGVW